LREPTWVQNQESIRRVIKNHETVRSWLFVDNSKGYEGFVAFRIKHTFIAKHIHAAIIQVMKKKKETIYAFIDSQNLNLAVQDQGWKLDFTRFRVYLKDKYKVEKAYLFIGYIAGNETLYTSLQNADYTVVLIPSLTNHYSYHSKYAIIRAYDKSNTST